ncbi:MAG TPA: hypothetical protein VKH43_03825 [Thermoanaerobaculia bacterium]|nr:hypothetical protein [Thermoanaerobaculia bacterium]
MIPAILAVVLLAASAPFGPRHVWRPPDGAVEELHRCSGRIRLDCVKKVLARHGGTPEAFEFYRKTGWFLSELKETGGPVRVATLLDPWRANENEQPALVNGAPPVVYPEDADFDVEKDAAYRALREKFPNLLLWKPGAELEGSGSTPKGQSFLFRYRLLDGCHACPVRGFARVEFLFGRDGTFLRAKLLGVVPAT